MVTVCAELLAERWEQSLKDLSWGREVAYQDFISFWFYPLLVDSETQDSKKYRIS